MHKTQKEKEREKKTDWDGRHEGTGDVGGGKCSLVNGWVVDHQMSETQLSISL